MPAANANRIMFFCLFKSLRLCAKVANGLPPQVLKEIIAFPLQKRFVNKTILR